MNETGWLLDDGVLCLGVGDVGGKISHRGLKFVTYTDPGAIRFARKQDAENMITALKGLCTELPFTIHSLQALEHSWG